MVIKSPRTAQRAFLVERRLIELRQVLRDVEFALGDASYPADTKAQLRQERDLLDRERARLEPLLRRLKERVAAG